MSSAVGYTRLSQESDTSIARQKRHVRKYADEQGLTLEQIYDDGERSSGFDEGREEYQALRECVQSGEVGAVIVNDKRRLARDFDETMRLVLDLRELDVEAHTYQEGKLDLSDPVQAAVEVLQAASEHEAKKKEIERSREAVQERLEEGYDHGRPPIGFTYDDNGRYWVPDSQRFDDVVKSIRMVDNGATYSEVHEKVGISPSTMSGVMKRRERYLEEAE